MINSGVRQRCVKRTPHWNLLLFVPPGQLERAKEIIHSYALADSPNEPGAQKRRVRFEDIDPRRGDAVSYIAKYIPGLYNRLSILMLHVAKLEEQVGSLIAENTALRSGDKSRQLAAELGAMQERIGTMLADVGTAEIIEFTPLAPELRLTA